LDTNAKHDYKLVFTLLAVGLMTGALTTEIDRAGLAVGAIFGITISIALLITGASQNVRGAVRLTVVSFVAFFLAYGLTFYAQLLIPGTDQWSMSHNPSPSALPLFFGGTLGAFLVLGEALHMIRPEVHWFASLKRGFEWSPVGGALAVIGGLAGPRSETSIPFALTIVWQAGIGGLIGYLAAPRSNISGQR